MLKQGVCGVTNPPFFQKRYVSDACAADEVAALKQQIWPRNNATETGGCRCASRLWRRALPNTRNPISGKAVSSASVSANLSKDAQARWRRARRLYAAIGCKNAMIKVPPTRRHRCAHRNPRFRRHQRKPDLLFSRVQPSKPTPPSARGIYKQQRPDKALPISTSSPASSSPVWTALDLTRPTTSRQNHIALAKTAYQDWAQYFGSEFATETRRKPRAALWASLRREKPGYPDTLRWQRSCAHRQHRSRCRSTLHRPRHSQSYADQKKRTKHKLSSPNRRARHRQSDMAARLQEDGLKQFEEAFETARTVDLNFFIPDAVEELSDGIAWQDTVRHIKFTLKILMGKS